MRLTRLVIGFLVILVAVFIIAGEQLSGASADAVINARLTTVRAPVSGLLSLPARPLGSTVSEREQLGSIRDPVADDIRLNDLVRERAFIAAESDRLAAVISAIEAAIGDVRLDGQAADAGLGPGQRASALALRLAETKAALRAERARAQAVEERISVERLRVNRLSTAELVSNVAGRVWEVLASDGETVQRGHDVMRLVDCRSTMVTLSVSENVYNRLGAGDTATFRVNGDGRAFEGTITRLAGSGAQTVYRNLAIAPGERHLQRYDVALLVPALREDAELGCAVGRTGRAFFEARPLDLLRRIWR